MSIAPTPRNRVARDGQCDGIGARLARFRKDEAGGLIIFSLFILVAMMLAAGLAIDFMRFETTRTRLQNTVDRAVLAAASLKQSQDPEAVVRDYFAKAGLSQYVGPIKVTETMAGDQVSFRRVVAATGATMNPIFLSFIGMDEMPIMAYSAAEEGISDLEISIVLDVSGSMSWASATGKSKIHELREAAKDFVYHMQCNPKASRVSGEPCEVEYGKVSISIVPYSEQVAVGPKLLGQYNVTNEHNASFCVDFTSDDYKSAGLSDVDLIERTGHFDPWRNRNQSTGDWTCRNESWRWIKPLMDDYTEVFTAIDALSAGGNTSVDIGMKWGTALLDPGTQGVVTNLTAEPVTTGSSDMVIDPVFDGRPYDYGQSNNMKAVILMTDGVNTDQHYLKSEFRSGLSEVWHYRKADNSLGDPVYSIFNASTGKYRWVKADATDYKSGWQDTVYVGEPVETCGWEWVTTTTWWGKTTTTKVWTCTVTSLPNGTPYQMTYPEVWAKFTTKWYDYFSWLDNPVLAHGNATKNTRLQDICTAAKNEDILVYTIGFEVGEGSAAETVMEQCATTVNHFFLADGMNLSAVFGAIASSLNRLRLTE